MSYDIIVIIIILTILLIHYLDGYFLNYYFHHKIFHGNLHELYFDNNAHVYPSKAVQNAIMSACHLGNPSAAYACEARAKIDEFKKALLQLFGMPDGVCIITSGASEANGFLKSFRRIVCSDFEHKSIMTLPGVYVQKTTPFGPRPCDFEPEYGNVVSVMACNNETGDFYDVENIARKCHELGAYFHTDATQYFGKMTKPLAEVDYVTISMHKIGGPLGVGAFLSRNRTLAALLCAQITGTQNGGLRGGTENVPAIAGALCSLSALHNRPQKNIKLQDICSSFMEMLLKYRKLCRDVNVKTVEENSVMFLSRTSINTVLVSFINKPGPVFCNIKFRNALAERNVKVSIGSACNTGVQGPSHVLLAMKLPYHIRRGVVRFSFYDENHLSDIRDFETRCFDLLY